MLFQPHLYSRTRYLAQELAAALAGADAVAVADVYPAREQPIPGVSGKLIVDELARVRPGLRLGWAPSLDDAVAVVASWARAGDTVLTLGAGDVERAAPLLLEAPSRIVALVPVASAIWLATVRCQISS